jgi:hypothetical protein
VAKPPGTRTPCSPRWRIISPSEAFLPPTLATSPLPSASRGRAGSRHSSAIPRGGQVPARTEQRCGGGVKGVGHGLRQAQPGPGAGVPTGPRSGPLSRRPDRAAIGTESGGVVQLPRRVGDFPRCPALCRNAVTAAVEARPSGRPRSGRRRHRPQGLRSDLPPDGLPPCRRESVAPGDRRALPGLGLAGHGRRAGTARSARRAHGRASRCPGQPRRTPRPTRGGPAAGGRYSKDWRKGAGLLRPR